MSRRDNSDSSVGADSLSISVDRSMGSIVFSILLRANDAQDAEAEQRIQQLPRLLLLLLPLLQLGPRTTSC